MTSSSRARSFGAVAENYDRYRPSYPAPLVADVIALLPGRRVVEIGAGTGIATSQFVAHARDGGSDLDITCVEPDAAMADVLAGKFTGDAAVGVVVATLESWSAERDPAEAAYDGLICAQAWHWTSPATRWRDAAAALASGGVLALFWNRDGFVDPAVVGLIGEIYDRYGIGDRAVPISVDEDLHEWPASEVEASVGFTDRETRTYRWAHRRTVVDYVARLNTVSAHLIQPADTRDALTRDLLAALTRQCGDEIELAMRTDLALARRI